MSNNNRKDRRRKAQERLKQIQEGALRTHPFAPIAKLDRAQLQEWSRSPAWEVIKECLSRVVSYSQAAALAAEDMKALGHASGRIELAEDLLDLERVADSFIPSTEGET